MNDFYEDDEPVGKIRQIFSKGKSGLTGISWAVECCGEHLYTAEERRIHNEQYHGPLDITPTGEYHE